jgi:hypothetical protein
VAAGAIPDASDGVPEGSAILMTLVILGFGLGAEDIRFRRPEV